MLDITTECGGMYGHHHGIGTIRSERYRASSDHLVHAALKQVLDPNGQLLAGLLEGGGASLS